MANKKRNNIISTTLGIRLDENGRYSVALLYRKDKHIDIPIYTDLNADQAFSRLFELVSKANRIDKQLPLEMVVFDTPNVPEGKDGVRTVMNDALSRIGNPYRLTIFSNRAFQEDPLPTRANIVRTTINLFDPTSFLATNYDWFLKNGMRSVNKTLAENKALVFNDIFSQLDLLAAKKADLKQRGHQKAFDSAEYLEKHLRDNLDEFIAGDQSPKAYERFRTDSLNNIELVRPVLEKHRGWAEILSNLSLAVITLGIFFLPALLLHRLGSNSFFCHPQTESDKLLDGLRASIHEPTMLGMG